MTDLRYAARSLARNPGFAAVAILTLAVGIGATTVIFTIFHGVLLKPLAFREPDRLIAIQESVPGLIGIAPQLPVNALHYSEWVRNNRTLDGIAMVSGQSFNLTSDGDPIRIPAANVSAQIFPLLGLNPLIGRTFTESENQPGNDNVVLISEGLWTSRFHRDPQIAGRKIRLDGRPFEVVGVLPAQPRVPNEPLLVSLPGWGSDQPQMWAPFALRPETLGPWGDYNYGCVARLKPGVTPQQATADLDAIEASIVQRFGGTEPIHVSLTPLREQMTGSTRESMVLLMTAVGAVLGIICVNVASLMLIRVNARQREIAIRAAIGASASRLMRQILAESLLIAALGGGLGIALAYALLGVVIRNAPAGLPRLDEVHIDAAVLAAISAIALFSGLLFGWLPARRFARADPNSAMKGGRSATEDRRSGRARNALVGFEVALSAATLIAAGLLLNSFVRLMRVDKGFQTQNVLTVSLNVPPSRYDAAKRADFFHALLARVQASPGVIAVGITNMLPLEGEGSNNGIILEGQPDSPQLPIVDFRAVSPDFFRALGVPLHAGRIFDDHDRERRVALVSTRTARQMWPGVDPIGKRFHLGSVENALIEVIGITGDVHGVSLQKDPNLTVYLPYWQRDRSAMILVLRTAMDPTVAASAVRQEVARLDSQMALPSVHTMQQQVDNSVASRRFQMNLVLLFGASALLLAALGVYGVISYSVSQRTREMGIRMVLGARGLDVRWLVLRQGLAPVVAGLAAGIAGALLLGRWLGSFLFGVRASDPATFAGVVLVVLAATAAGCWLPARRATRVDPATALRFE